MTHRPTPTAPAASTAPGEPGGPATATERAVTTAMTAMTATTAKAAATASAATTVPTANTPDRAKALPAARAEGPDPSGRFLARAAGITAALTVAGSVLGLVRDQVLAHFFGAGQETDAFLVAWTLPEFASTLLIEDGTALVLVPAFSLALALRAANGGGEPDPVRALVRATLPKFCAILSLVALLLVAGAPWIVESLAPGLPRRQLAVDCTRLTATCALSFGLAGYCGAALRVHRRYLSPASIYVAYNTGIIAAMALVGAWAGWGVRAAALGVALGGGLMVLVQAPFLVRELRARRVIGGANGDAPRARTRLFDPALLGPVLCFALFRQSQVLVERWFGSELAPGAISHLNYAQKVAQVPMVMSLMLATVTFPVVSKALAEGRVEDARRRVERDLSLAGCVVLLGAAAVIACAGQIVELLFQRGAFTATDTAATAAVMRVYALGLLGHTLVGALIRSYFSAARRTWYPAAAMLAGLTVTALGGALLTPRHGVLGLAAANALGISTTAALMLAGPLRRSLPLRTGAVTRDLAGLVLAAALGCLAAHLAAARLTAPAAGLTAGTLALLTVSLGTALALRLPAAEVLRQTVAHRFASRRAGRSGRTSGGRSGRTSRAGEPARDAHAPASPSAPESPATDASTPAPRTRKRRDAR
ncbi:putative peptidoglycan lipid II flippase [Streptomyces sp. TverLS-915]|uniref:lipid II flippase MurJ n=1 Tax=Streptomyces sp. TverLS-915 TaxID=1839763 RepID=UPI00081F4A03|nr:lipid II flippase MurJ [Streptomyces sp. TverLS-915]SCD98982.1 putative peptidoglycan lipid II flippase [Streptomyces sp. TverLS-915]